MGILNRSIPRNFGLHVSLKEGAKLHSLSIANAIAPGIDCILSNLSEK